jgi:hypothetical protein
MLDYTRKTRGLLSNACVRLDVGRESRVEGKTMITADNWEVIQGDEGCGDRHYRDEASTEEEAFHRAPDLGPGARGSAYRPLEEELQCSDFR